MADHTHGVGALAYEMRRYRRPLQHRTGASPEVSRTRDTIDMHMKARTSGCTRDVIRSSPVIEVT